MHDDTAALTSPRSKGISLVIPAGIVTTILTLFANWWLTGRGFNAMGLYVWLIIPAGAIGVGILAASGYMLAAWLRGEKIGRVLLFCVFGLQSLAYVQAQYAEYQHVDPHFDDGTPMSFTTYFDLTTRDIAFQMRGAQAPGKPLGVWGYGVRALEFLGFTCGGLLALRVLLRSEYCENCQRYMRNRAIIGLPASSPKKKVRKSDTAGAQAQANAEAAAVARCQEMLAAIHAGADRDDSEPLRKLVEEHRPQKRKIFKLPSRVYLRLFHCTECQSGYLFALRATGHGNNIKSEHLFKRPVSSAFVKDFLSNQVG